MRFPSTLRAAATSLALFACGGDDDASSSMDASTGLTPHDAGVDAGGLMPVALRFRAKLGSEELVCGQRYTGLGSTGVAGTPRDFRFFVHDVRLLDARGAQVPVQLDERPPFQSAEVALLDFTEARGSCTNGAPESNTVLHGKVPAGTYTGLAFSLGVPPALNHADPALSPPPLEAPGVHWTWRQGYRFVLAELDVSEGVTARAMDGGVAIPDAGSAAGGEQGVGVPGLVFAHIGSVGCSGSPGAYLCSRANRSQIVLADFDPAKSTVTADLAAVFANEDLSGVVQCHGDDAACRSALSALGIDPVSGAPAATQRVFRSE
ncbi:MAG: MbnP family copper-binding protein [Polyangiales bacterium]